MDIKNAKYWVKNNFYFIIIFFGILIPPHPYCKTYLQTNPGSVLKVSKRDFSPLITIGRIIKWSSKAIITFNLFVGRGFFFSLTL